METTVIRLRQERSCRHNIGRSLLIVGIVEISLLWQVACSARQELTTSPASIGSHRIGRVPTAAAGNQVPEVSNDRSGGQRSVRNYPTAACGLYTCNLLHSYCDRVISMCARCDDDCHPARIQGDWKATSECRKNCAVYYSHQTTTSSTTHEHQLSTTPNNDNHEHCSMDYSISIQRLIAILLGVIVCCVLLCTVLFGSFVIVKICGTYKQRLTRRPRYCDVESDYRPSPVTSLSYPYTPCKNNNNARDQRSFPTDDVISKAELPAFGMKVSNAGTEVVNA